MPISEADTCRRFIEPKLRDAGWDDEQICEQRCFTDGRVIVAGNTARRGKRKQADYILRYTRDFPLAIIEAKSQYRTAGDGLQQAKEYAEILDLKFAYASNGHQIIEFDYITGQENAIGHFPSPDDLWSRLRAAEGLQNDEAAQRLLTPYNHQGSEPRYYQDIAIKRAVQAILRGQQRILLTLATGTGKTKVAFQICWKLWQSRWNRTGEYRRPKMLFLADRNILVDDPKTKDFAPFGDACYKIENGTISLGREMYFAIYQAIAKDERRPGLYKEFPADFFDLIVIDECHRGSARDASNWREILDYFEPAYKLGMTATPKRRDNIDTYRYFGNPLYTYSLRQGIGDGFLAPYRVHRIITTYDAAGWRPSQGERDRYGRDIPDEEYQTKDFERVVALKARTKAIARSITDFLKKYDRFGKTIVFCVDQEHADEMRRELNNLNADLVRQHPDYVCRVTADEQQIGRGHLDRFKDVETITPVIVTTSQLLTTGVDVPTCRNVVLARVINSIVEFKQIIGRGTRIRDEYNKLFFNILDYTQSTRLFADPQFDGDPEFIGEIEIDDEGEQVGDEEEVPPDAPPLDDGDDDFDDLPPDFDDDDRDTERRKYYVDGGQVEIAAHLVYELDTDGNQLRVVQYSDYTAEKVRLLARTAAELRDRWVDPVGRCEIIDALGERGIDFDQLAEVAGQPDADPFDLLCHVAFDAPLRTRRERAERLRTGRQDFFDQYGPEARQVLEELLEKYSMHGTTQFSIPEILQVPPISAHGNVREIADLFGGIDRLRAAVQELQSLLYSAA
ncbi:MAG: DEAD/DEAH box helicase family protein [Planctomycetes bacterium]|nr:DEAD/DEAH box helicase family protein [Planctomycetota bacterium]